MAKLEKLTKEQEDLMEVVRDKWINIFNNNSSFNDDSVINGIKKLYEFCDLQEPDVYIMDNPYDVQKKANELTRDDFDGVNLNYIDTSYYMNYQDAGWVSFYDFFTQIGVINDEAFNNYRELMENGIYYSITLDEACIVSRPPKKIVRNDAGLLNNVEGYAVEFDGEYQHYVGGVYIEPEMFEELTKQEYTFEDFTREKNEETKNAVLSFIEQKFGGEALYDFLSSNLTEIDTYKDVKDEKYMEGTTRGMNIGVYTLYKGQVNNVDLAFVRCYCPSTDRMFFLGVTPDNTSAKDAIASLYRIPRKLKDEIKYITRQGERYSTVFQDITKAKSLSKEELSDLVSLTGDEYFNLLTYEY